MEQTLILLKPDALQRGLVGEIITRFERVGLKLVGMKMVWPNKDHYYRHYEEIGKLLTRRGQTAFDVTLQLMGDSPVVAVVLEGVDAASLVRKMVGTTEPKSAVPGTIRGDYAHVSYGRADEAEMGIPNLIHASADADESALEIKHWFKKEELFDYGITHEHLTQLNKRK